MSEICDDFGAWVCVGYLLWVMTFNVGLRDFILNNIIIIIMMMYAYAELSQSIIIGINFIFITKQTHLFQIYFFIEWQSKKRTPNFALFTWHTSLNSRTNCFFRRSTK